LRVVDKNLGAMNKHLADLASAGATSRMAEQAMSGLQVPSPAAWAGIKAFEQQWLLQRKLDPPLWSTAITQSLSHVPEVSLPVSQSPEWLDVVLEASRTVGSYFSQISSMVERVADAMAGPLSQITLIGEELTRSVQGWQQLVNNIPNFRNFETFWEGLQPALQEFMIFLEDANTGREVLKDSEFGFADHFWGVFYVRGFAHIHPRVRSAVVTNKLASYTRSDVFIEELAAAVGKSQLLQKRWRIIESAVEAHAARNYELAVPAILAQIEGTLVNLMFLKDLVKRDKNDRKFYLADENGNFKMNKKGNKRLPAVTLHPAITNAKLDEHPDLGAASEFIADALVQRRNAVLHGHDLSYDTAKFSVQALLILAVLATAVSEVESGNISPPTLP
jgi:hypothetical protein